MAPHETIGASESEMNWKAPEEGGLTETESQESYLETYSSEIESLRTDQDLIRERANAEKPYADIGESLRQRSKAAEKYGRSDRDARQLMDASHDFRNEAGLASHEVSNLQFMRLIDEGGKLDQAMENMTSEQARLEEAMTTSTDDVEKYKLEGKVRSIKENLEAGNVIRSAHSTVEGWRKEGVLDEELAKVESGLDDLRKDLTSKIDHNRRIAEKGGSGKYALGHLRENILRQEELLRVGRGK